MERRYQLQALLEAILGSSEVHYQPPSGIQLKYPCILYERNYSFKLHANNKPYHLTKRYQVTVIDRDPDSDIPDKIEMLPLTEFDRAFATEGLNHFIYDLYF